jgi:hypothetical protein
MAVCDHCNQEMLSADGVHRRTDNYPEARGCTYSVRRRMGPEAREAPLRRLWCASRSGPPPRTRPRTAPGLPAVNQSHGGCVWAGEEHVDEDWVDEMEERFQLVGPDQ